MPKLTGAALGHVVDGRGLPQFGTDGVCGGGLVPYAKCLTTE